MRDLVQLKTYIYCSIMMYVLTLRDFTRGHY